MTKILRRIISAVLTAGIISGFLIPVSAADIYTPSGWEIANNGDQDLTTVLDTEVKHSGNASLKLSYNTEGGNNVYAMVRRYIDVQPNTLYKYSMWVKGNNVSGVQTMVSWGTRYDINSLGKNFDWKKFEFSWYSGDRTRAEFQFILTGSINEIWIDDLTFCKDGSDRNEFANPGFEDDVKTSEVAAPEVIPESALKPEFIKIEDAGKVFHENRYLPVFKKSGITVDGNASDWGSIPGVTNGNEKVNGTFKIAYDEEYFYLIAETPDMTHRAITEGTGNWQEDSIQFVIGSESEPYGREVNISFAENGPMYFYSEQWHHDDFLKIKSFGIHDGSKTVYEIALPWELTDTSYKNNDLLFCLLINDEDGNGRNYYEFTHGIGTTKTNKDFIKIDFVGDEEINGAVYVPNDAKTDKNYICNVLAVNNTDSAKNSVITTPAGANERKIPANSICVEKFVQRFNECGDIETKAEIKTDTAAVDVVKTTNVVRTTDRIMKDYNRVKEEFIPELRKLIEECQSKNIPVDYELAGCANLEFFIENVPEDLYKGEEERANYILNCLFDTYAETKGNLGAYLSGQKEAKETYKYVTGDHDVQGQTIWTTMKNTKTGDIEKRPVYQMGYNAFGNGDPVNYFGDMGFNSLAIEIGIDDLIVEKGSSFGWTELNRKDNTTCNIVFEDESKSNSVLKIVSATDAESGKYLQFYKAYEVKPNTTYEFGLRAKGTNVQGVWFSINGWGTERKYVDEGTYGWKNYDFEYTTTYEDDTVFNFFVFDDGKVDEILIDDIYVREKGTKQNLIENGNFEYGRNEEEYDGMIYTEDPLKNYLDILDNAAEKNISIQFQIATHYYPNFTLNGYDSNEVTCDGHFTGHINYTHDRVRQVTEYFLRNLMESVKDKPAFDGVILGNEPGYCTMNNPEFYEPLYAEYLNYIYEGDISKLNKNYGSNYKSFEDVTFKEVRQGDTQSWLDFGIELSHIEKTPMFYDWMNFNYEVYADWAAFMYSTVKKYAPDVKVHIKQLAGTWRYEHNYFRQWLRNGVKPEKIAPFTDYNGTDAQGILNNEEQSIQTKMRWYDYLTSIDNAPVVNSEDHSIPDNSDNYTPQVATWAAATTWLGAVHGCSINDTWVWAKSYDVSSLRGSIYVRPDAALKQATSTLDLNRLALEVNALTDSEAEVAVMDSLSSQAMDRIFENVSFNAWQSTTYNGLRCDFITEKQASEGKLNQYKVVILPKCDRVNISTINALRSFIANGGRVVMFGEDCLKFDEYGNPYEESVYSDIRNASRIVPITYQGLSMTSPTNEEIRDMLKEEYDKLGITHVKLIDTATGKLVYDVEWESAVYNENTIININNYNWSSLPTVAVEVNGKRVSEFKELRSGEVKNGTIALKPYEPVLLQVPETY